MEQTEQNRQRGATWTDNDWSSRFYLPRYWNKIYLQLFKPLNGKLKETIKKGVHKM